MDHHIRRFAHRRSSDGGFAARLEETPVIDSEYSASGIIRAAMYRRAQA